jgi:hypothetical protein
MNLRSLETGSPSIHKECVGRASQYYHISHAVYKPYICVGIPFVALLYLQINLELANSLNGPTLLKLLLRVDPIRLSSVKGLRCHAGIGDTFGPTETIKQWLHLILILHEVTSNVHRSNEKRQINIKKASIQW